MVINVTRSSPGVAALAPFKIVTKVRVGSLGGVGEGRGCGWMGAWLCLCLCPSRGVAGCESSLQHHLCNCHTHWHIHCQF